MCTYLHDPESYDTVHDLHENPGALQVVHVNPYAGDSDRRCNNVAMQEHFIEGVSDGRRGLNQEEDKSDGSDESSHNENALGDRHLHSNPSA